MVTQVNARAGAWLDGVAVAAQDMRLQVGSAFLTSAGAAASTGIAAAQGVRPGQGSPLLSTWTSGMSFTLNAGTVWVQGTAAANAGMYTATLDTTTTLIVPNGDPTNPRIDSVIAVLSDVGSSSSTDLFKILPGTPAGSPVAPTLPANAVRLANIAVAASASVLSAGNFTDLRAFTCAVGGILLYGNTTGASIPGPAGSYVDDQTSGRLKRLDGANNARAVKTGAFTPATAVAAAGNISAPVGTTTTYQNLTSVTTDGVTEVEFNFRTWSASQATPTIGDTLAFTLIMDGVPFDASVPNLFLCQTTTNANNTLPLNWSLYATPSAATHTFGIKMAATGSNAWLVSFATVRIAAAFN